MKGFIYARSCCSSDLWVFGLKLMAVLVIVFIGGGSSVVYESLPWTPENPMFMINTTQCTEGEFPQMNVLPDSTFHVICPTTVTVLETVPAIKSKHDLIENLWIIYDKKSFETCNVNTTNAVLLKKKNRPLMECDKPLELKYYTIVFQRFSAVSGGLEFTPGETYYFLATSDGTTGSLNNTAGGHCNDTKNGVCMRFKVYVCKDENDSNCTEKHKLGKLHCKTPPTSSPPEPASTPSQTELTTEQISPTGTLNSASLTQSATIPLKKSTDVNESTKTKGSSSKRMAKEGNTDWKIISIICMCSLGSGTVAIAIVCLCKRDKTGEHGHACFVCCPKINHKQVKNKAEKECPMYSGGTFCVQGNSNIAYDPDHLNDNRKEQQMGDDIDCYETLDETRSEKSTQTDMDLHSNGTESPGGTSFRAAGLAGSNIKPPIRLEPITMAKKLSDGVNGVSSSYSRPLSTFGKDGIYPGLGHKMV